MNNLYKTFLFLLLPLASFAQEVNDDSASSKFEISFGLNAVDIYLNQGFGLPVKSEESFLKDFFTSDDWNTYSKSQFDYPEEGARSSSLPPVFLRVTYKLTSKLGIGAHVSFNYLDIIDLCYNAVGISDMQFNNSELFVRYSAQSDSAKIQPLVQIALGRSSVKNYADVHLGLDAGVMYNLSENYALSLTSAVKKPFGTSFSEYFQHQIGLVYRFK